MKDAKIKKLRVGSRSSRLARVQVEEVHQILSNLGLKCEFELLTFDTTGDRDRKTPLITNTNDDFFTDTLDEALINNKIDIAIHSAKDLPQEMSSELTIYALTASLDATDAFVGNQKLADLKAGAKIGTSSLIRKQGIEQNYPHVKVADIRGDIEDRIEQWKSGKYEGVIIATCALKRLKLEHEIKEILPWEPTPLQGQLAVVGCKEDIPLRKFFAGIDIRKSYGRVALVGAGPGDPDLITVKAIKALKHADCVFYDFLIHNDLLSYAPQAEKIYVGKRKGDHTLAQRELSRQLRDKALTGNKVVRLKGGDPFIFGRGADELDYLSAYHIRVDVIPGVSSATGIPAGLGIPLTARGVSSSVAFLSAYQEAENDTDPAPIRIPEAGTLVFLMGLTKLPSIVRSLVKQNWKVTAPIIVISKGTYLAERVVLGTLNDIEAKVKEANLQQPALIIVGQTVKFWQKNHYQPQNILYVGTNPEKYKTLGHIVHHPMIEISAIPLTKEQEGDIKNLIQYDMLLFTSRFAVTHFLEGFHILKGKKEELQKIIIAVIGQDTALALNRYDLHPRIIAEVETSEGMLESLEHAYSLKGKSILFPRSSISNPFLENELTKRGCQVKELAIYQNTKPPQKPLPGLAIEKVLFTSPSTVKNFLADYHKIPDHWEILCKGPRTQAKLKEEGYASEILLVD